MSDLRPLRYAYNPGNQDLMFCSPKFKFALLNSRFFGNYKYSKTRGNFSLAEVFFQFHKFVTFLIKSGRAFSSLPFLLHFLFVQEAYFQNYLSGHQTSLPQKYSSSVKFFITCNEIAVKLDFIIVFFHPPFSFSSSSYSQLTFQN